jgi:hypothetical protein
MFQALLAEAREWRGVRRDPAGVAIVLIFAVLAMLSGIVFQAIAG